MSTPTNTTGINSRKSYTDLWDTMVVDKTKVKEITAMVNTIVKNKARYEAVCKAVGGKMPWYYVGIIHAMEASCNFTKHLHNGDPLKNRTVQVPANRPIADPAAGKGKPYTWEESAIDCCKYKGYDKIAVWDLETVFYQWERNNGFGYKTKGLNSPYLYSYTNQYTKGKYVADGKYDPNAISKQAGCAALLSVMIEMSFLTDNIF